MGWEVGRRAQKGEDISMIHTVVWQKPEERWKATVYVPVFSLSVMSNSLGPFGL